VIFTICSNNYLDKALVLNYSLRVQGYSDVFLCITDQYNREVAEKVELAGINYFYVSELDLPYTTFLHEKYNVTELNTAVKPAVFKYLYEKYQPESITYLDPDIWVASPLEELETLVKDYDIIITPHMCSPVDDGFAPSDFNVLPGGVFNLGYITLGKYERVKQFLDWWEHRTVNYGHGAQSRGMFYDQLWINYVPAMWERYHILKHPGYNMANWNLHERILTKDEQGKYWVNNEFPLRFFHFSGYNYQKPDQICKYASRYTFDNRPDLKEIFTLYQNELVKNDIAYYSNLIPAFGKAKETVISVPPIKRNIAARMGTRLANTIYFLFTGKLKNYS
jgi:hypothetical protein